MIKTFEQFINESVYYDVTLIEREVDCSGLTEKEFVDLMSIDIKHAQEQYVSLSGRTEEDIYTYGFKVDPTSQFAGPEIHTTKGDDIMVKDIVYAFNKNKNEKYFKVAKGWRLTYTTEKNRNNKCIFGGYIKLILDDSIQKQYDEDKNNLERDIHRFYSNSSYNKYD